MFLHASYSLVDILWSVLAFSFLVAFVLHKLSVLLPLRFQKSRLHVFFQDLIRYGKTKETLKRDSWLRVFDVPKRWFWHFYFVSVVWNGCLLFLTFRNQSYPKWLGSLCSILGSSTNANSHGLSTLLVQFLIWIHSLRRLLECLVVSVFSNGSMHMAQYLFGVGYYIVFGLTVLSLDQQTKGWIKWRFFKCMFMLYSDVCFIFVGVGPTLSQLDWYHVIGIVLFSVASVLQHQCMVLLAGLRTGESGLVETLAHKVPHGGLFEWVSCPHYFAELLIYTSFSIIYGGHSLTCWLVVLYVFFNQALAAQLCHELYITKYKSYPRNRRAFIPFLL
ncbi:polyprenal reductase [Neosynchiropus ocellatus]